MNEVPDGDNELLGGLPEGMKEVDEANDYDPMESDECTFDL